MPLAAGCVLEERDCWNREAGAGGAGGAASLATCLTDSDNKLWNQTCHFKKRGGIHRWLFAEIIESLLIIARAAIDGDLTTFHVLCISKSCL